MGLHPDFLSTLLASRIFMRLSLKKAAHVALASASSRKSGSPRLFFDPRTLVRTWGTRSDLWG
jgi:hypothetical protein